MIAMPNSHLVLHKETLKQIETTLKNKTSIKHLIEIINLGAKKLPCRKEWVNGLSKAKDGWRGKS